MEDKVSLRRIIREKKAAMSEQQKALASDAVASALEALPSFRGAGTVLAYWSMSDELDIRDFILRWSRHKRMVLPVVVGDALELRVFSEDGLVPGYRGIMEPGPSCPLVDPSEVDLALVPGMAFDPSGRRMGRGGGFYDRLLPVLDCPKLGLCYPCQLVDEVPVEDHDVTVDAVICGQSQNNS